MYNLHLLVVYIQYCTQPELSILQYLCGLLYIRTLLLIAQVLTRDLDQPEKVLMFYEYWSTCSHNHLSIRKKREAVQVEELSLINKFYVDEPTIVNVLQYLVCQ